MRDVQRTTLVSNGNAKPTMTIFAALPIPPPPPSQRSKGEATSRDAKELVVRRTIFSSDLCRISRHQISVRFFVQHLLVSTTEARVTSWRACRKKTTRKREAWRKDPSIDKTICSSIKLKKRRDMDVQGWTHQRCLAPESCSLIAI